MSESLVHIGCWPVSVLQYFVWNRWSKKYLELKGTYAYHRWTWTILCLSSLCSSLAAWFFSLLMIYTLISTAWVAWEDETMDFKEDNRVSWRGGSYFGGLYCFLYQRSHTSIDNARNASVYSGWRGRNVRPQNVENVDIRNQESRNRLICEIKILGCRLYLSQFRKLLMFVKSSSVALESVSVDNNILRVIAYPVLITLYGNQTRIYASN